jgi:hypothetical protein
MTSSGHDKAPSRVCGVKVSGLTRQYGSLRVAVTPRCRSRHRHGWEGQWGARARPDSGEESGLVYGVRRSADAGDQYPAGSSPACHRAETVRDERVARSRGSRSNDRNMCGWQELATHTGIVHVLIKAVKTVREADVAPTVAQGGAGGCQHSGRRVCGRRGGVRRSTPRR